MLWVYGNFSNLEKIAASSFIKHGYQLTLWTYGDISNAPAAVTIKSAAEVVPESMYFTLPNGSCAPFSDLFRYAVLSKHGGMWVDTDVVAIQPLKNFSAQPFLVTEREPLNRFRKLFGHVLPLKNTIQINGNVIFNPLPTDGNIVDLAYTYCWRFPKQKIQWGELGPRLLSAIEGIYPHHGFTIMPPNFANPIDWWKCPDALLKPNAQLPAETTFLHVYNETWRRNNVDKNAVFPKHSIMARLADEYL